MLEDELMGGERAAVIVRVAEVHQADENLVGSRSGGCRRSSAAFRMSCCILADRPVVVIRRRYVEAQRARLKSCSTDLDRSGTVAEEALMQWVTWGA